MPPVWLAPLLQYIVPAVIGAGGTLIGAGQQAKANRQQRSREEEAAARQAASMEPFLEQLIAMGNRIQGGGDYSGMRAQAMSNLDRMSEALNAQLAQRGIYSSGAALGQQRQLAGDVYSQLAQAINADQLSRQQIGLQALGQQAALSGQAAQMIAATPGYGYFDQQTGRTRGK